MDRLRQRIADLEAFDPQQVQGRRDPSALALQTAIDETLSSTFGHDTIEYRRYSNAGRLDGGPMGAMFVSGRRPPSYDASLLNDVRQYLTREKAKSVALLGQAIRFLEEEIADQQELPPPNVKELQPSQKNEVFVVHGHDEAALQAVARFLERLELPTIVLREQPDQGRTIIEKFEDCASRVGFTVVLLTPDDVAGTSSAPAARARQNVIFELGYFAGKLGRGRTCLLRRGEVEIPSDLYGVIYTELDPAEGWKIKLVKELKAAGMDFDANKAWG
ncbi:MULTISPECIES: nucleotide-binding protein [unclassified Bradyrhizobium]|uniref:nucleotide-binding protein n=1 Tax=unclassified Bradyrhizobium TaxID=2631580 RepID=UPI0028F1536E|nr:MULTISPECIES: nucleotide-binding protein [unclassified Bradyrhizobium]